MIRGADGKTALAHRLAWELEHGPIPPGMNVLHHCDNPPCADAVDTEHHLFLGTQAVNNADRDAKGRNGNSAKTRCPRKHLYTEANTRVNSKGKRECLTCRRDSDARCKARRRAARILA